MMQAAPAQAQIPPQLPLRLSPLDHAALRWPQHEPDEIAAVTRVLETGRVNAMVHGEQNRAFEAEFAAFCGMPHGIAVSNGTVALELALRALGVGAGDEVILPSRSFFASAACIVAVGATPVFADIDPVSNNIDPESARRMLSPRSRAIICVHLAGWPCDMTALRALADERGLWLVEDCAQAHGATLHDRAVGSFGDAAAFSFCTDKIMSTGGEGGMLLLRQERHWKRAWAYKDHGKNPDKFFAPATTNGFRYLHDSFGSNWRMTEMQAAIGRAQLAKLPGWLAARRRNAATLMRLLRANRAVEVPAIPAEVGHAFYRLYVTIAADRLGETGTTPIIGRMVQMGMPVGSGSCADMTGEAAFADRQVRRDGALPVAQDLGRRSIAFPVDHLLDEGDMHRLANCLEIAMAELPSGRRGERG
ncbi:DegT/DnrJ/EryC1/StrS family aminotransferase [Sphingobium fuliginis]|jgi:dTDP-4-amino-4,6-dideoxygalactose transaminase|uniref:DegT/DnrJ/EryC1/StrS family aminotransferase n=1 Tax=Sphingobium fuliginis (strain ATCC 27551) TaxID=336203 RepID=A0A292ZBU4_SPHSA|nr:DegT/DnrJ/EryC1/StrS family aminotransferase [Sphingobium fuliginis]QOT71238.1 DegT/DnrJ/EryC1/StrS family aminotransferase [Sphingobium fuliginis]GAY20303.1 lipopolysaccharide biosynthesis protein RffA [Sphingobium fuliginis]